MNAQVLKPEEEITVQMHRDEEEEVISTASPLDNLSESLAKEKAELAGHIRQDRIAEIMASGNFCRKGVDAVREVYRFFTDAEIIYAFRTIRDSQIVKVDTYKADEEPIEEGGYRDHKTGFQIREDTFPACGKAIVAYKNPLRREELLRDYMSEATSFAKTLEDDQESASVLDAVRAMREYCDVVLPAQATVKRAVREKIRLYKERRGLNN